MLRLRRRCCTICRISIIKPTSVIRYHIRTQSTRVITKKTFLSIFLETEIDDSFSLIVLKTSEFRHITLLVNHLDLLYHIRRNVLCGCLYVITKELLAINTHGFYLLTIDGNITFFIHLHAVHFFEKFLYRSRFRDLVCRSIVLDSVSFDSHFGSLTLHTDFCQLLHLFDKTNGRYINVGIFHFDPLRMFIISYG